MIKSRLRKFNIVTFTGMFSALILSTPSYSIDSKLIRIPPYPNSLSSIPIRLNDNGEVIGFWSDGQSEHRFSYNIDTGKYTTLPLLPMDSSIRIISDDEKLGFYGLWYGYNETGGPIWGSNMYDLSSGTLVETKFHIKGAISATVGGVNNLHQFVGVSNYGWVTASDTLSYGFMSSYGTISFYQCPGANNTAFTDINNAGDILGICGSGDQYSYFLKLVGEEQPIYLNFPELANASIDMFNDKRQLAGVWVDANHKQRVYVFGYDDHHIESIEVPGAQWTSLWDINNRGDVLVVGYFGGPGDQYYVYHPDNTTTYSVDSSIVGTSITDQKTVDTGVPVSAVIPLGGQFTLSYNKSTSGQATQVLVSKFSISNVRPSIPEPDSDQYNLETGLLDPNKAPLFPNQVLLGLGTTLQSVPQSIERATFMAIHLGSASVTIQPSDASQPAATINVTVVPPSTLGDPSSTDSLVPQNYAYDPTFVSIGNQQGIPPQFLKGIARQESQTLTPVPGGKKLYVLNPTSFRYEPISIDVQNIASQDSDQLSSMNYSQYIIRKGAHGQDDRGSLVDDDIALRSIYKFVYNIAKLLIRPLSNSDQQVTIGQILAGNLNSRGKDVQNWGIAPDLLIAGKDAIVNATLYRGLAQTPVASSYGLMHITFETAADYNWIDSSTSELHRPSELLDPVKNISLGAKVLGFKMNYYGDTDFTDPQYESYSEFEEDFMAGFLRYNGGSNRAYPGLVKGYAGKYTPLPSDGQKIFK